MKIIILCKRAPQSKDLWLRPYGRFYHLANCLAKFGNEVHFVLLNYTGGEQFEENRDGMTWHSINLLPDPSRYFRYVRKLLKSTEADWIVGFSDTYFGICANLLAKIAGKNALIDAYDNFEAYLPWCFPLHWLWRKSLQQCTGVTAAGPGLLQLMSPGRSASNSAIIEMAADQQFQPGSQERARRNLGLPLDKKLITYCGSLYRSRGVEELFELMARFSKSHPEVYWVLSGRLEAGIRLPKNCHYLGYVDDDKVADILRSADLMLCVNKPGQFGDYSYPVKIYEAMATGVQVIAFQTDSVSFVMRDNCDGLVEFGDIDCMAEKISGALTTPLTMSSKPSGWDEQGRLLQQYLATWGAH